MNHNMTNQTGPSNRRKAKEITTKWCSSAMNIDKKQMKYKNGIQMKI